MGRMAPRPEDSPDDQRGPDDFEDAWARIVADLSTDDSLAATDPPPAGAEQPTVDPGLAALFEPLRPSTPTTPEEDPGAFVDSWADEGHFTPPPPPELPEGTPLKRFGWAGLLGGPATLAFVSFTGWDPPRVVLVAAAVVTLAGFVTLVWQLPEAREDGWDDGARL
jgi:hypothetical protein